MSHLEPWPLRPAEEGNLFNPAFVGSLIYEFVKSFQKVKADGVPITYVPIALTVALHRPTRLRLPGSTGTSLYDWLQRNEDVLVGFHNRVTGLLPYVREAMQFSIQHRSILFSEGHRMRIGATRAGFSRGLLAETTVEVSDAVKKTQFLARWFVKSGSESSILASWGVRP